MPPPGGACKFLLRTMHSQSRVLAEQGRGSRRRCAASGALRNTRLKPTHPAASLPPAPSPLLHAPHPVAQGDAGHTAALVIAKVAAVEVPRSEWPELIGALLANMAASPSTKELRQSTLEALGYTCEVGAAPRQAGAAPTVHSGACAAAGGQPMQPCGQRGRFCRPAQPDTGSLWSGRQQEQEEKDAPNSEAWPWVLSDCLKKVKVPSAAVSPPVCPPSLPACRSWATWRRTT